MSSGRSAGDRSINSLLTREVRPMKCLADNQFSEALGGKAIALELNLGKGDRAAGSRQKNGVNMSKEGDDIAVSVEKIIEQIEGLLLETWQSTGFGSLTIESDRKNHKIRVIIKAGTHFRYVISDEDIVMRAGRKLPKGD
jgi:hypothetical protein